ncbi:hypothetical protein pdam_00018526, partial [Pocillopora damicornis]
MLYEPPCLGVIKPTGHCVMASVEVTSVLFSTCCCLSWFEKRETEVNQILQYFVTEGSGLHQSFCSINPLHPNISMHILLTVLYTFPNLLTRRTLVNDHFLYSHDLNVFKQASPVKLKAGLNGNLGRQRHESKFKASCVKEHNAMSQPCLAQGFPNQESEGQVIKQLCL